MVIGPSAHAEGSLTYRVMHDAWTDADERGYSEFIAALGENGCHSVNQCLHSTANPFAKSDPPGTTFFSDCADMPYYLRAYYAWKRGLPFSYISAVSPVGSTRDIRYTARGNTISNRRDITTGSVNGLDLLVTLRNTISSATYRMHPDTENTDLYPVRIDRKSIRPGSVLYDPNGHLAVVYKVEQDGRILYIDAHPDNSMTHGTYGRKFVRSSPGMGAGFKNWRPAKLVGATRAPDGAYLGGTVVYPKNAELPDYSTEQFFGNGERPADREWASGGFMLEDQLVDYYDYMRAKLGGGTLAYDPIVEVRNMVRANCDDIRYRAEAVDLAVTNGIHLKSHPSRLPQNIYGTEGEWEEFSTPSRDARLKTSFKELRDQIQRFIEWHAAGDKRILYQGASLARDLLQTYDTEAAACVTPYTRTDGSQIQLGYEEVRRRLFWLSFDPYHCIERRWGAAVPEVSTCRDDADKFNWYAAEQYLRNQIDRTYDARMNFDPEELKQGPGPGKGVAVAPDIDVRAYLFAMIAHPPSPPPQPAAAPADAPPQPPASPPVAAPAAAPATTPANTPPAAAPATTPPVLAPATTPPAATPPSPSTSIAPPAKTPAAAVATRPASIAVDPHAETRALNTQAIERAKIERAKVEGDGGDGAKPAQPAAPATAPAATPPAAATPQQPSTPAPTHDH